MSEEIQTQNDGNILEGDGIDILRNSMSQYGFYVNENRAIINNTDGLKPVQRRLLYTFMFKGLNSSNFRKSAEVTGTNMATFHPHGDAYGALVRMVQKHIMNIPLVEGQGNFGSLDTPPAANRYTEVKITKFVEDVLFSELKYRAVEFEPNYSATEEMPVEFPAKIPLGLINSNTGIGYGVASKIPCFNINEIIDSLCGLVKNPEYDITKSIKGADFPTAGQIINPPEELKMIIEGSEEDKNPNKNLNLESGEDNEEILKRRATKRVTSFRLRGNIEKDIENNSLIINELPYMVSSKDLQAKILELKERNPKSKITEVEDLSGKGKIQLVVFYKKGANLEKEKNYLFSKTPLETSFSLNLVVLNRKGKPVNVTIKQYLLNFIGFRRKCFVKKIEFQIEELEKRLHILEGLLKLNDQDLLSEVINKIRKAEDVEVLKQDLMELLDASIEQVNHIVNLKLISLSKLEFGKLKEEYDAKIADKLDKEDILANRVDEEIVNEWNSIKNKYGYERRTRIEQAREIEDSMENFTENKDIFILLTEKGYIKRMDNGSLRVQNRGGAGISSIKLSEDDSVKELITSQLHDRVFYVSNQNRIYFNRGWDVPEASRSAKGIPVQNFLDFKEPEEAVDYLFSLTKEDIENKEFLVIYKDGLGVRVKCENAIRSRNGSKFCPEGKEIASINLIDPKTDKFVLMGKNSGKANKVDISKIPLKQSVGAGVKLITLENDKDSVRSVVTIQNENDMVFILSGNGYGKRVEAGDISITNRGTKGVNIGIRDKDTLVGLFKVSEESVAKIITKNAITIKTPINKVTILNRSARGLKIMRLQEGDSILQGTIE